MSKRKRANSGGDLHKSLDQSFRLKKVSPLTDTQADVFDAYHDDSHLALIGVAGTGKSYLSLYLSFKEVLNPNSPYRKIYVVRSSVPSRDMGFMPGTKAEKMSVYEAPYVAMVNELFGRGDAYQVAVQKDTLEMLSTSFLRGVTFENAIVIADEIQNCTFQELDTLITRVGNNCKLILCGDVEQCDLYRNKYDSTGLPQFLEILDGMQSFEFIEFMAEDIVRSGLVKEYILEKRKKDQSSSSA